MRSLDIENITHLQRLRITRVKLRIRSNLWCFDFSVLKNTSIEGMSNKIWKFECGIVYG